MHAVKLETVKDSLIGSIDNVVVDSSTGDLLIGDYNNDGVLNILDLVGIVDILLFGIEASDITHLDINGDGGLNILDLITLVYIILMG